MYCIYAINYYNCTQNNYMSTVKNKDLTPKLIHLSEETISRLIVKAANKKPRITVKEYIQQLCEKEASK